LVSGGLGGFHLGSPGDAYGHKTNWGVVVGRGWDVGGIAVDLAQRFGLQRNVGKSPFVNGLVGSVLNWTAFL
jgi:hypothetical protein